MSDYFAKFGGATSHANKVEADATRDEVKAANAKFKEMMRAGAKQIDSADACPNCGEHHASGMSIQGGYENTKTGQKFKATFEIQPVE